jgi:hypothetical protein
LQKFALWLRVHERERHLAESPAVFQKECGKNRDEDKQPGLLRHFGNANARTLRQAEQNAGMAPEKHAELIAGVLAHAVLDADVLDNLPAVDPFHQFGERFGKLLGFVSDARPNKEEKQAQEEHDQEINGGNGAAPALAPLLHAGDGGIYEIGKEDGEKKGDESSACFVEKGEAHRKHEYREEDARRA